MSPDDIIAIADSHYDSEHYESPSEKVFALLVDAAQTCLDLYKSEDVPDIEDPNSFKPSTIDGRGYAFTLIQGLIENLEIQNPDDDFR